VDVKKRGAYADMHPSAVFAHSVVNSVVLAEALLRIADDVLQHGVPDGIQYRAARQLLRGRPPRLRAGTFEQGATETAVEFAVRISTDLDDTVLAIQGPPGAGKTFYGGPDDLRACSKRSHCRITAVSHKVILNLLNTVVKVAGKSGLQLNCLQKVTTKSDPPSTIEEVTDNSEAIVRLGDGRAHVLGGTQWLWARPEVLGVVDVLFVDEARSDVPRERSRRIAGRSQSRAAWRSATA